MNNEQLNLYKPILCCPDCQGKLLWKEENASCQACLLTFPIEEGRIHFIKFSSEKTFQKEQMCSQSLTWKLYNFGRKIISSEYTPINYVKKLLLEIKPGSRVVEIGSGNRRLREDVFGVDLFAFPGVDALADAAHLPFQDKSVDFFILDTVLEHVCEPQKIINEIYRCLAQGGKVICITTFIFPFHGYPSHYFNFTKDGLSFLFRGFSHRDVAVHMGPTSALINLTAEYFTVILAGKSNFLYTLFKGLFLIPIFLFKYIDILWFISEEKSSRLASHFCVTAVK